MEVWSFIAKFQFHSPISCGISRPAQCRAEAVGVGFNPILVLIPMTLQDLHLPAAPCLSSNPSFTRTRAPSYLCTLSALLLEGFTSGRTSKDLGQDKRGVSVMVKAGLVNISVSSMSLYEAEVVQAGEKKILGSL